MESVNNNSDIEAASATSEVLPKQKEKIQTDRVTLGKDESERLTGWLTQIKNSTKGFLDLTRSDVVNFLIQSHSDELTAKEIKKIRLSHYSLIKHLNWITPQLKKAIEDHDLEKVRSLQLELRGLELGIIKGAESKDSSASLTDADGTKKQRVKKSKNKSVIDKNESVPSE